MPSKLYVRANISIKEYNKISEYKDLEIENMLHFNIPTKSVIAVCLEMIKKGTDKYINKVSVSPSLCELQRLPFAEPIIFLEDFYICDWKTYTRKYWQNVTRSYVKTQ